MKPARIGVIGLGNVLMGDDAFGPWVVQTLLAGYEFPEGVSVEDLVSEGEEVDRADRQRRFCHHGGRGR